MNYRILSIAEMVRPCDLFADIGTDHGQLPIDLVEKGIVKKACACDIAAGPLSSAEENIRKAGLDDRISCILSNGLENVPAEVNSIVIAGMGWLTAQKILEEGLERLPSFQQIIVQVNQDTEDLRRWISMHHYTIDDERLIRDHGFDYEAVSFTTHDHQPYTEEEILIGPVLLKRDEEALHAWCGRKAEYIRSILARPIKDKERIQQLNMKKACYEKHAK